MKKMGFLLLFLLALAGIPFYFAQSKSCKRIPIYFSKSFEPIINAKIQNKQYGFLVDSGACNSLYLVKNALDGLQKTQQKRVETTFDFRGNKYNNPVYSVENIRFGPLEFSDCEILEETLDFHINTNLWSATKKSSKSNSSGKIGWSLFKDYCALFDFPNSSIFLGKNFKELADDGLINLQNCIAVPFSIENGILLLEIETDLGRHRVILDSGATFCCLKPVLVDRCKRTHLSSERSYFPSSKLVIEGCDFGEWGFAVTDFSNELHCDGALGNDFFLEHAICCDFPNKMIYICKPTGWFATQWKRGKFHLTHFFQKIMEDL